MVVFTDLCTQPFIPVREFNLRATEIYFPSLKELPTIRIKITGGKHDEYVSFCWFSDFITNLWLNEKNLLGSKI